MLRRLSTAGESAEDTIQGAVRDCVSRHLVACMYSRGWVSVSQCWGYPRFQADAHGFVLSSPVDHLRCKYRFSVLLLPLLLWCLRLVCSRDFVLVTQLTFQAALHLLQRRIDEQ